MLKTILISILFIVVSCSVRTPVKQVYINEVKGNLKYKNIIFRKFDSAPGVHPYSATAIVLCKNKAISYLRGKAIFQKVADGVENSYDGQTLLVDATVTNIRIVGVARFWVGALAGRSHMKILVELTDATSGSLIVQKELFGAPNALGSVYSFGYSDRHLAGEMGILLGDFILANVSK